MTIISWIRLKGGINFRREHWKGELRHLQECLGNYKYIVKVNGKTGYSLDALALMAHDEGFISEPEPGILLEAIEHNKKQDSEYKPSVNDMIAWLWYEYEQEQLHSFWRGV